MSDFLLELRCEEIPARMQAGARADLERLLREQLGNAGVEPHGVTVWSTPRRLALIARGLPDATQAVSEEAKGPPEGAPDQAIDGFCRKNGVTREQLQLRDVKGRNTYFAVIEKPGRAVKDLLAEAIPAIVRAFPWPKSMRWGDASISTESLRWVRPLSGIVAIFGEELVACEVSGISSGVTTLGHRFHHDVHNHGEVSFTGADDYVDKLRAAHVIVDHTEREGIIREGAAQIAEEAGLVLVEDEGLVVENAGLTEWPVPLLGRFDKEFLEVPPEVIQLTARTNQKYFVCQQGGKLADAFICTTNIVAVDGGDAIVDGNRKVLAARLSDARFFWEVDRKKTLAEHAEGLKRITFHEKLGTVADKVARVAKLARWLVEQHIVKDADPDMAEQAALLCKADLVTEMVGEFPELQGLMGGYYARAEGLPDQVCDAIRDHYKPVGQGDEVPTAPVTVAVSLADKLDTIREFYRIDEKPTGSKDPFALRRAAIAIAQLAVTNKLPMKLVKAMTSDFPEGIRDLVERAVMQEAGVDTDAILNAFASFGEGWRKSFENLNVALNTYKVDFPTIEVPTIRLSEIQIPSTDAGSPEQFAKVGKALQANTAAIADTLSFVADRLKVQQREAGVRHDLIDAVFALGGEDDLVRLLARVKALQSFITTEDGTNLLAGYKRAANILKKEDWETGDALQPHDGEEDPFALVDDPDLKPVIAARAREKKTLSYSPEDAEKALIDSLDAAEPLARASIEAEDFAAAMSALASLRAPIDRFFDEVTVNDENPAKRAARLDLLARFRAAVHNVADFSRIEG